MWIIRFHLLQTKHYNKVQRICKKYRFCTRSISPTIYAKASIMYMTQKTSWRSLGREFHVDHISLYKFYIKGLDSGLVSELTHVFLSSRSALYIGNKRTVNIHELDNSSEIYELTHREFESILKK